MSSPSTKTTVPETRCPECGKGILVRVVVADTFNVEGCEVHLEGLMPYQCPACKELTWPESECRRAREQAEIKLRKAAA